MIGTDLSEDRVDSNQSDSDCINRVDLYRLLLRSSLIKIYSV